MDDGSSPSGNDEGTGWVVRGFFNNRAKFVFESLLVPYLERKRF